MSMTDPLKQGGAGDLELLSAWAEGKAGATQRISRRAWLVLESLRKQDPYILGEVGSGTSRVHELLGRYRRLGVLGLLDNSRTGRPKVVDTNLNDVLTQAGTFHPAAAAAVIRTLPKSVKEALWRENRRGGTTLERDRRMRRSRVAAPIGLPALLGLLSLPGLMVIASANEPDSARFSGGGVWLGEREIGESGKSTNVRTTNLAIAIEQAYADTGRDARSAPSTPRLVHQVFPQFHEWVNESAAALGGDITVEVTLAQRNAPYALVYLPALKEYLSSGRVTHLGRVSHPSARLPQYRFSTYRNRAVEAGEQLRRLASTTNRLDPDLIQAVSKDVFSCWMRAEVVDADTWN